MNKYKSRDKNEYNKQQSAQIELTFSSEQPQPLQTSESERYKLSAKTPYHQPPFPYMWDTLYLQEYGSCRIWPQNPKNPNQGNEQNANLENSLQEDVPF